MEIADFTFIDKRLNLFQIFGQSMKFTEGTQGASQLNNVTTFLAISFL